MSMAALPEIRYEIGLVIRYKTSCYKEAAAGEGTKSEMVRHAHRFGTSRRDPSGFSERNPSGILVAVVFRPRRRWSVPAFLLAENLCGSPRLRSSRSRHASPSTHPLHPRPLGTDLSDLTERYSRPLPGIACLTSRGANAGLTIPEYKKRRGQHAFGDIRPTMSYWCLRIALYVRVASLCGGRSNE